MRCLLKAEFCTDTANTAIRDGSLDKTIRSILDDLKPEAAYFLASNGKRTAYLFLNMQDTSQIPALAEPWFLALHANVEIVPVMGVAPSSCTQRRKPSRSGTRPKAKPSACSM
jgi:hypothetical protein